MWQNMAVCIRINYCSEIRSQNMLASKLEIQMSIFWHTLRSDFPRTPPTWPFLCLSGLWSALDSALSGLLLELITCSRAYLVSVTKDDIVSNADRIWGTKKMRHTDQLQNKEVLFTGVAVSYVFCSVMRLLYHHEFYQIRKRLDWIDLAYLWNHVCCNFTSLSCS